MMKITPHQISAFTAVCREKSFSRAAQSLNLSQSAITQHITSLEQSVGTKLFLRSRNGTEMTSAGIDLFDLADRIQVLETQLLERANNYSRLDSGKISVCVSTPRPALRIISEFKHKYPGIEVEIKIAPWKENIGKLRNREVDISIVVEPDTMDGYTHLEIERRPFVAITPINHKLSSRKRISIHELSRETMVLLSQTSYTMNYVKSKFAQLNFKPFKILKTGTYEMILESVIHNIGVSIILDGSVSIMRDVHRLAIKEFNEDHGYFAVTQDDKLKLNSIRAFFDIVGKGQQPDQPWKTD